MGIGYSNSGNNNPSCCVSTNTVQCYIGTAYDDVQCVAENMGHIVLVSQGCTSPILRSPDGTCFCLVVGNDGTLTTCNLGGSY